ncbi:MAG: hypothetical protein PGN23_06580 [Sphingomonas adhaesiva]|uniref:hypothetical protein n=1 Tax=Sphingomonas TaxID=13687 RepID=UPI002FF4C1FF
MKSVLPLAMIAALSACATNRPAGRPYGNDMLPAQHPYGNDALPSAEVTAFQAAEARFRYRDARIERDANGCAVYRGTTPAGQVKREPLLDPAGKPVCSPR